MRKLLFAMCAGMFALAGTPAAADQGWSEFVPVRRGYDRPYVVFAPGETGRSGRFVSRDDGYFARGRGIDTGSGKAAFDYDRDYPYDYRSFSHAAQEADEVMREPSCAFEHVPDAASGGWTDVRVCRN